MTLQLGSDLALRHIWFTQESMAHPAKAHLGMLAWLIEAYTQPGETIGDPMAGIGSILIAAAMQRHVIASEIEPRWQAELHRNAAQILDRAGLLAGGITVRTGDARQAWGWRADHVIFSPPYGCSASPNGATRGKLLGGRVHTKSLSRRWAAKAAQPTAGAAGAFAFAYGSHPGQMGHWRGARYWEAMRNIYSQAHAALRDGFLILILKDHINKGQHVATADQTVALCTELGFVLHARHIRRLSNLSMWQRRRRERGDPVIEHEDILVFVKGGTP